MQIRCPHCHNAIEVVEDSSFGDVECSSCGSLRGRAWDDPAFNCRSSRGDCLPPYAIGTERGFRVAIGPINE